MWFKFKNLQDEKKSSEKIKLKQQKKIINNEWEKKTPDNALKTIYVYSDDLCYYKFKQNKWRKKHKYVKNSYPDFIWMILLLLLEFRSKQIKMKRYKWFMELSCNLH